MEGKHRDVVQELNDIKSKMVIALESLALSEENIADLETLSLNLGSKFNDKETELQAIRKSLTDATTKLEEQTLQLAETEHALTRAMAQSSDPDQIAALKQLVEGLRDEVKARRESVANANSMYSRFLGCVEIAINAAGYGFSAVGHLLRITGKTTVAVGRGSARLMRNAAILSAIAQHDDGTAITVYTPPFDANATDDDGFTTLALTPATSTPMPLPAAVFDKDTAMQYEGAYASYGIAYCNERAASIQSVLANDPTLPRGQLESIKAGVAAYVSARKKSGIDESALRAIAYTQFVQGFGDGRYDKFVWEYTGKRI